jgi:type I restriction enzyme, S subunit
MSSVNSLKKLLNGVAVEWTVLGDERFVEIANAARTPVKASLRLPGTIPYYGANNIQDFVDGYTHNGEYVLIAEDGSASLENYSIQYATGKFWANNHVHVARGRQGLNTRYLYHYLRTVDFIPYLPNKDRSKLTKGEMTKIPLPIPCPENLQKSLEIQTEIVRILDSFTELTTELTAELTTELTARRKQYNYYRDQLLNFEDGDVEWKLLGDLCSIGVGQAPLGHEIGEYAFVNAGTTPSGFVAAYNTEPETITTPSRGQGGIGYVGYQTTRFWCGPLCYRIRSTSKLLSTRFLYHVMANSMKDIVGLANMTGVPALNKKDLVGFPVPIPPLAQQERIAAILDKFDALTNSITEGLPREIALRQKQYAYYCHLLLNFPRPEEVAA